VNRWWAYFVPPTGGQGGGFGCGLFLFMSGTLLALTVALALNEVNPA